MEKLLMWKRRRLWTEKNCESKDRRNLEESMNENLAKEQKSQEQQLRLWKDRPRLAKEEMPDEVFQILQKQHDIEDNDSANKPEEFNEEMWLAVVDMEIRELRELLKAIRDTC
jgi:hypothetical protein